MHSSKNAALSAHKEAPIEIREHLDACLSHSYCFAVSKISHPKHFDHGRYVEHHVCAERSIFSAVEIEYLPLAPIRWEAHSDRIPCALEAAFEAAIPDCPMPGFPWHSRWDAGLDLSEHLL